MGVCPWSWCEHIPFQPEAPRNGSSESIPLLPSSPATGGQGHMGSSRRRWSSKWGWSISLFLSPQESFTLTLGTICLPMWRKLVFPEQHEDDSDSIQKRRPVVNVFGFFSLLIASKTQPPFPPCSFLLRSFLAPSVPETKENKPQKVL